MNKEEKIETIIKQLIDDLKTIREPNSKHWNERYLHHMFSYLVQQKTDYRIDITGAEDSSFHPEWATSIKVRREEGGVYAKIKIDGKEEYEPRNSRKSSRKKTQEDQTVGTSGFIDFAIGCFNNPDYAIEFKMAKNMDAKGFAFDYMKLLDSRNKITKAISLCVIYGRKEKLEKTDLDANLEFAKDKLKNKGYLAKRDFCFYVLKIFEGEPPCLWKCTKFEDGFEESN